MKTINDLIEWLDKAKFADGANDIRKMQTDRQLPTLKKWMGLNCEVQRKS